MANSKYKSSSIFLSKCICYLASLLSVAIVLTLVLPSFLGTSPSLRIIDKKDDAKIPVNITTAVDSIGTRPREPFTDLKLAYDHWDSEVGCSRFRDKFRRWTVNKMAVQQTDNGDCSNFKLDHVSVHVKMVMWIPDNLDGLYECRCELNCLWTRNEALADRADVGLYQFYGPPETVRL